MTGLALKVDYRAILRPSRSILSLTTVAASKKNVIQPGGTQASRLSPREHFLRLDRPPDAPLVVVSARNVLSNTRCIGYSKEMCRQFGQPVGQLAVVQQEPAVPGRPYHAIRYAAGRFHVEEFEVQGSIGQPQESLRGTDWLISGTPVLWDCGQSELMDRIMTDAADPAHIWKLPRGNHPQADSSTRAGWERMHRVFVDTLAWDRDRAAAAIRQSAQGLAREDEYLHCVWGVGNPDELIVIIAHGTLEEVGAMARAEGATRAICVENGGSIAMYSVPKIDQREWLPLIRSPNLRPAGTAFVFHQLADSGFSCIRR